MPAWEREYGQYRTLKNKTKPKNPTTLQFCLHKGVCRHTAYKLLSGQKITSVFSTSHHCPTPGKVLPKNTPAELLVPATARMHLD